MKNEVNQRLKFLRFYKMTEKIACQKKTLSKNIWKRQKELLMMYVTNTP
jgi:hypothetical protein